MNDTSVCLVYGAIIALAVSLLKRIPFVRSKPKVVAGVLSFVIALFRSWHGATPSVEIYPQLLECLLVQLTASVGTYEMAIRPVAERTTIGKGDV